MRSETAEAVTRSQRPLGGLLHAPLLNGRFYGWRQVRGGAIIRSTFFGRVNASSEEGLGNPPFFLAVRKERSRHSLLLGDGGTAGSTSVFDAFPPSMAAFPAAFFIACGRPNQERSPLPLLTVLLLLTGGDQEEGDGASEREDGTSGVWAPRGSFFALG